MKLRIVVSNPRWLRKNFSLIKDLGLEIEIVGFENLNKKGVKFYKKLICGKVPVSLHGASIGLDPGSLNKKVKNITKENYLKTIQIANSFSVDFVVFHSCLDSKLGELQLKTWMERQIDIWEKIDSSLSPKTKIVLENVYERNTGGLKILVNYINRCLKKKRVGICVDVGHLRLYSRETVEETFKILRNKIKYVHLHTNNRKFDQHKPVSSKTLKSILNLIKSLKINPILCLDYGISDLKKEILRLKPFK